MQLYNDSYALGDMLWPGNWQALQPGEQGRPILVVDDDKALCEMLEGLLQDAGYNVVMASNGQEALRLINQERPSLVLLDLMMPVMDGWKFLAVAAQRPELQSLPVVLLSANSRVGTTAGQYNSVKAYLPKPFDIHALLAYVQQHRTP